MAHQIVLIHAGWEAVVTAPRQTKKQHLHVATRTYGNLQLYDSDTVYDYSIREWVSPTECRATLMDTRPRTPTPYSEKREQ